MGCFRREYVGQNMLNTTHLPDSLSNTMSFILIVTAVAICPTYLAIRFVKENRQLTRELRRFQQQAEEQQAKIALLTAPKPSPPPKTEEQWETERQTRTLGGRDMAVEHIDQNGMDLSAEAVEEMARYGITRAQINHFFYRGFRYTNLEDAIAEAKRHPRSG
jgi:hypothetical protein